MKDYIRERVMRAALIMLEERLTLRKTAKRLKVSKSTIHKDVTERLLKLNPHMHRLVRDLLNFHIQERSYRGGRALREKLIRQNNQ